MGDVIKREKAVGFPGTSVWGSPKGPFVYLGEIGPRSETVRGLAVNLNERESREVAHAWGWPSPEQHDELVSEHATTVARVDELEGELAAALETIAELEANRVKVVTVADVLSHLTPQTATAGSAKTKTKSSVG